MKDLTGRKIENEGFNRQKNWQGSITHTCSWDDQAQKNHYLMAQISDFVKQLYEYYYLEKNGIKKKQKNISSDLLASFGRQLTKEDIFPVDENTQSFNCSQLMKIHSHSTEISIAKEVVPAKRKMN